MLELVQKQQQKPPPLALAYTELKIYLFHSPCIWEGGAMICFISPYFLSILHIKPSDGAIYSLPLHLTPELSNMQQEPCFYNADKTSQQESLIVLAIYKSNK